MTSMTSMTAMQALVEVDECDTLDASSTIAFWVATLFASFKCIDTLGQIITWLQKDISTISVYPFLGAGVLALLPFLSRPFLSNSLPPPGNATLAQQIGVKSCTSTQSTNYVFALLLFSPTVVDVFFLIWLITFVPNKSTQQKMCDNAKFVPKDITRH